MWCHFKAIDDTVTFDEKWVKSVLLKHPQLQKFVEHCCHQRHYFFCITKCGKISCEICKPPRLPVDVFQVIKFLPDPVPDSDGHYKPFDTVYGTNTSEEHCPSLQKYPSQSKTLPFVASIQHAHNTNLMLQCQECDMWRLVYSKHIKIGVLVVSSVLCNLHKYVN